MINADAITHYTRDRAKLEELLLFWICAAGKTAHQQAQKLEQFLQALGAWGTGEETPFLKIRQAVNRNELLLHLQAVRIGQYTRIARAFEALAFSTLDLARCSVEELETIPGIGPKTARCFVLHTRRTVRVAGLDTHILKFLAAHGVANVPRVTPSSKREYARLEAEFLRIYDTTRAGLSIGEFDLLVWSYYAGRLVDSNEQWFETTFLPNNAQRSESVAAA